MSSGDFYTYCLLLLSLIVILLGCILIVNSKQSAKIDRLEKKMLERNK